MHQLLNRIILSIQQPWARRLLPFTVLSLLMLSIPVQLNPASANSARERCEGFRFVRDRSDHEAPILPRQSVAARAVWDSDHCAQPRAADERSEAQSDSRVEAVEAPVPNSSESLPEVDPAPQPAPTEATSTP
jgi:hypothetical protein